jgi:excinuclease ABC subunit C
MKKLKQKIKNFPTTPGIYIFKNADEEIIYVGKASSLRNRVRSYFQKKDKKNKTAREVFRPVEEMIDQVSDIDYKKTDSALEAIILEAEYIKKYQPKYNVLGKDNKSWNFIVTTNDQYPTVDTIRQHQYQQLSEQEQEEKFEEVFGPYPRLNTKETLKILRKLFNYSDCQTKQKEHLKEDKPCLYYQMGECLGVCTGEISPEEYNQKVIKPLKKFLSGGKSELVDQLEQEMQQASGNKEFEEAARIRDQIEALQKIHDVALIDKDFIKGAMSINQLDISRIEGYDISNLGKTGVVGSMIVFRNEKPEKSQYRKFKIKDVEGQSDVDSLKEVIERRAKYIGEETNFAQDDPDLILVDGGQAQVNSVREVLQNREVKIPVMGIAKGPDRDKNELIMEGLPPKLIKWIKDHKKTLVQVRDEAHRFALKYQKKIREKSLD